MPEVLSYASSRDLRFSERRLPSQVHSRKPVRFSLVYTAYVNLPTTKAKKKLRDCYEHTNKRLEYCSYRPSHQHAVSHPLS